VIDGQGEWVSPQVRADQISRQEHFTRAMQEMKAERQRFENAVGRLGGQGSAEERSRPGFGLGQLSADRPAGYRSGSGLPNGSRAERQGEQPMSGTTNRGRTENPPATADDEEYVTGGALRSLQRRLDDLAEENRQWREQSEYRNWVGGEMDKLVVELPDLDPSKLDDVYANLSLREQAKYEGMPPHLQYRLLWYEHGKDTGGKTADNGDEVEVRGDTPFAEGQRRTPHIPPKAPDPLSGPDAWDRRKLTEWTTKYNEAAAIEK